MRHSASAWDPQWYKDAVVYELHVKAFFDSNQDGVGDFHGLMEKIDYLQDLGVTCLWLLPFYPSPFRDDGYDVSDYQSVHPNYGTLDDFKQLVQAAHARRMQVVTELVINHTSDAHPWFQQARTAPPGSPLRDFYVWSDTDQKYRDARIIFLDTERSNWSWVCGQACLAPLFHHQPDLNFDNPAVFGRSPRWLARIGVGGFRLMPSVPDQRRRVQTFGHLDGSGDSTSFGHAPQTACSLANQPRERPRLLRRRRHVPHGIPLSLDDTPVHRASPRGPQSDHRHHGRDARHSR